MSISRFFGFASRSLRVRFLVALLLGAAIVSATGSYLTYKVAQSHIQKQLIERSTSLASAINHSAMIARTNADLHHVVEAVVKDNVDIQKIVVMLKAGQEEITSVSALQKPVDKRSDDHLRRELATAINTGKFGFHIKKNMDLVLITPLWPNMSYSGLRSNLSDTVPGNLSPSLMSNMHQILGESKTLRITQDLTATDFRGGILLRVDRSDVIATMSNILWGLMPLSIIGVSAILALTYVLLHFQVITPIGSIRQTMKLQQSGDRQARAARHSTREFDEVALAFNGMIDAISEGEDIIKIAEKELIHHRDHLQTRVDTATRELRENAEELENALDKEKELNKLQREFVSMASHEFRTPLAIIDGSAQRIKTQIDKNRLMAEDGTRRIEKIRGAVQRMARLMESRLDVARMDEGKIRVEISSCNIAKIVADVCARQCDVSQNHVISCDLDNLPPTIEADSRALEQVFTNLLSNAVKYAPDTPQIEVVGKTQGDRVIISVFDHGLGIDEDDLNRIGERFFRAQTSTGTAGTGIGLNLAVALVAMHDGTLSVESVKGEGSTFTISLPIEGPELSKSLETEVA